MTKIDKYLKEVQERHSNIHKIPGAIIDWENLNKVVDDVEVLLKMVKKLDYYYSPEETRPGLFKELEALIPTKEGEL